MRRLLSRTSITTEEAVYILLGRSTGPIDFEPVDESEEAEANVPAFCLQEALEDEPDQEALAGQADAYRCEIADELNKGEQSVLKVDRALSNAAYTYITLHSFNEWVKSRGSESPVGKQPDAAKPKPRTRLREQEDAILKEIERQDLDPVALPRNPSGKSGVKAAIRVALKNSPLFAGKTSFPKAWERLSKDGRIAHKT